MGRPSYRHTGPAVQHGTHDAQQGARGHPAVLGCQGHVDHGRREGFYWLAVLSTFALGTSAGDLVAEKLALGYLPSAFLFATMIALVAIAHLKGGLNAVLAFWAAYILTRPFGASMGDYLTAAPVDGGLGLGTNGTSGLFLTVIVGAVAWFTLQQRRANTSEHAVLG